MTAVIQPLAEAKQRTAAMRKSHRPLCTAKLVITASKVSGIGAFVEEAALIGRLTSLAVGQLVGWVRADFFGADECLAQTRWQSSPLGDGGASGIVDVSYPGDLENFAWATRTHYENLRQVMKLDDVVWGYCDSRRQSTVLELRGVMSAAWLDWVVGMWVRANPLALKVGTQETSLQAAVAAVLAALKASELDSTALNRVRVHLAQLSAPSFRDKLATMCVCLGVKPRHGIPLENDLRFVGEIRNKLIHSMAFVSGDIRRDYFRLVDFQDRLMMALLSYDGPFLDKTVQPFRRLSL